MSEQNRTVGIYIGTMPEDIFIGRGDTWEGDNGPQKVTQKKYITQQNLDYNIEVRVASPSQVKGGAVETFKTTPVKNSTPCSLLPLPPNLDPQTPEFLLSIRVGDEHLEPNMYTRTVVSKTFHQAPDGQISITVTYDK